MEFQLTHQYTPKGDQPAAIEGLAKGIQAGHRFQTLLGVTGSGKSLPPEEPIWIYHEVEGQQVPRLVSIGDFVDGILAREPGVMTEEGTEIAFLDPASRPYRALSVNPRTLEPEVQPVTAVHRHRAPES